MLRFVAELINKQLTEQQHWSTDLHEAFRAV